MPHSKIQIVVMDGKIAYVNINGYTVKNLNCEPKSILEVKNVEVYDADLPVGVIYACPD